MSDVTYNRTKIVCTIGPASSSKEILKDLILAGMDVARLNFSHGSHEDHADVIKSIRELNEELNTSISILADLQGPKIRIGKLKEAHEIKPGDEVILKTTTKKQDGNILPIQYATFAKDVNAGDIVLVDDGKVELRVLETNKEDEVKLLVTHGSEIDSKKGVNLPLTNISLPSITEKDQADLEFAVSHDVDWIALSFVRRPAEVRQLRGILESHGGDARIIAKIEKPQALTNIDEIIEMSDGIMIARGDMGVEIPLEDVPKWQKRIISKCNHAAKPVIVATQMMESMITNRRPTRAEASDVANAVMDGADALMLSGETSVGDFPVAVVQSMEKIIATMEEQEGIYYKNMVSDKNSDTYMNDTLIVHACKLADELDAEALIGMTASGYTAYHLSRCRPKAHIFIFSANKKLPNILNLVWGVRAFYYNKHISTDETIQDVKEILKKMELVSEGDVIVNTASMPLAERQRTNMIKFTVI